MSNSTRIQYLKKHRKRGDIKRICDDMTLNINTVYDIVTGRIFGSNGEKVLSALEKIIDERIKNEQRLSKKYGKKLIR